MKPVFSESNHILSVDQFNPKLINLIFHEAKRRFRNDTLSGKVVSCIFYQPSTRTYASFISAANRLGASVVPIQGVEFSSVKKGETLEDTIRTLGCYSDAIVLRHHEEGSAARAAGVSYVPLINAGDGIGEHPTQALLDLYTIKDELGALDGLTITFLGDIKYSRTVHSLAKLLSMYEVKMNFVSSESLSMSKEFASTLDERLVKYNQFRSLDDDVLAKTDVLYVTRVQQEYMDESCHSSVKMSYIVDQETLSRMKEESIVMHPLPRVWEIKESVDSDPRSAYFRQVKNGLSIRMALLNLILNND